MWEEWGIAVRSRSKRRRNYAVEYRRWLEEEEEREFWDMLDEFDGVDDATEEDGVGWLSFRQEFGGLLYFYVDEAEEEDWDEEIRREIFGEIGKYFKRG